MSVTAIRDIRKTIDEGGVELSAAIDGVHRGRAPFRLRFRAPAEVAGLVSPLADAFLAALLPTAMALRRPLRVDGDVSWRLLRQSAQIMELNHDRDGRLRPVPIEAAGVWHGRYAGPEVACFFSGGVDSFYTVLKNLDLASPDERITCLLVVLGFDLAPENATTFTLVTARLQQAADRLGLRLLTVRTNQRELTDDHAPWVTRQMSAGLASVGLALSPLVRTAYIAAGDTLLSSVRIAPSNALIDPLWSTDSTEFRHDGGEATRLDKIVGRIAGSAIALEHLRVCFANYRVGTPAAYNCGRCTKCVRTMIALHVADALERCPAFGGATLSPATVRTLDSPDVHEAVYLQECVQALEAEARDPELRAALRTAIARIASPKRRLVAALKARAPERVVRLRRWLHHRTTDARTASTSASERQTCSPRT